MLRNIKYIVVHSTQTSTEIDAEFIREQMKKDGRRPMYHSLIDRFGHCMRLMGCNLIAEINFPSNENCYHIAYVGGIRKGKGDDTRNPVQHHILYLKLRELKKIFPQAIIIGADYFGGKQNENPGFDVEAWMTFQKVNSEYWVDYEENEHGQWIYVE